MSSFLLGINYWPRRSAMYMWERFDLGEIREDMARIRSLGLNVVRFFIMWDDFQPQADEMNRAMLERFDQFIDAVANSGLRAMPTFFTGHMSGVNYLPRWALDPQRPHGRFRTFGSGMQQYPWGCGNFYTGELLQASRLHVRAIAERCRGHEALYLWDLGNEFSNVRSADSPAQAAQWSAQTHRRFVRTLRRCGERRQPRRRFDRRSRHPSVVVLQAIRLRGDARIFGL